MIFFPKNPTLSNIDITDSAILCLNPFFHVSDNLYNTLLM